MFYIIKLNFDNFHNIESIMKLIYQKPILNVIFSNQLHAQCEDGSITHTDAQIDRKAVNCITGGTP